MAMSESAVHVCGKPHMDTMQGAFLTELIRMDRLSRPFAHFVMSIFFFLGHAIRAMRFRDTNPNAVGEVELHSF